MKPVLDRPDGSAVFTWWLCACRLALLALLGLLAQMAPALAQTSVSGAIAVDTHWTAANSPYLVSGDVVVQNGAVLRIEPGVTVYMAAQASLTVQAGGIQALGIATNPIQVLSDQTRLGQAAAAGDWKQWVFNPGTVNTRLDYVVFEYGNGLAVKGSAPVLNFLTVRKQLGAAIAVDLAASPSGVGNQASGNGVNGIAVPAGEISGNVKWNLRGIPYVVASGVVSVGVSPAVASITPNVQQQGSVATITLTGTRLTGLSRASFDKAGLTAQILPGASDTQASLMVTADASVTPGTAGLRLLVDAGEVAFANALTLTQIQPVLTSLTPSALYLGQGVVDVTVNGSNFTNQSVVQVSGSSLTTQFLSATQVRTSFSTPVIIGNVPIRVRTPDLANAGQVFTSNELQLPVAAAQLVVSPSALQVVKGAARTFTVSLPYPAAAGGVTLSLVSSVPGVASVPATITVPQGQSTASFQLAATDLGVTVVTASKPGFVSGQAQVTVVAPPTLTFTPALLTLGVGRTADLVVQASAPAGAGGLTVSLASSNAAVATIPAAITIPTGASAATVTVSTLAIGNATITAQAADFVSASAAVAVRPVSLNLPSGSLVSPGLTRSIPLTLSDPAPAGGLLVSLVSSNAAIATVPASITVAAGQTSANFTLTGVAVGAVSVSATASVYQSATLPVTVDAVTIGIGSPAVTAISVPVENGQSFVITLSRPAPPGGLVIALATGDATKAGVSPSTVTIAEGQTSGGVVLASVRGVAKGATTLSASAAGLNAVNVPVTVTDKPELRFAPANGGNAVFAGKGFKTFINEVYIYRAVNGTAFNGTDALTVNLTSSDAAKAGVPATVTIPAGSYYAYFYVTGVDLTNGVPVTVDATAAGYNNPATKLAVNVITPVFNFNGLDTNRSPVSIRDDFSVSASVPGAVYAGNQTAAADLPINLSIAAASPAGIVDGFYSALTGGTVVTQVTFHRDNTTSDTVYAGTPTATGNYKVQASATGIATATSGAVTVNAPELRFAAANGGNTVFAGKGFKTFINEVYVYRAVNGTAFNGSDALTVNLTSSDAAKAGVPATVTIPAGSYYAYFYVTGVDLTNGVPVTVDATAAGYNNPATKLAVNVITPVFNFNGLDTNRSPVSIRDDFSVSASVPGAGYSGNQTAAADLPINLSIAAASPAGIVDGFYSALTGGTVVTQVTFHRDNTTSDTVYVGTPTAAGNYKVQASATGIATATSGVVTVNAPELRFAPANGGNTVFAGKGFKTFINEVYVYRAVNGTAFNGTDALTVNLTSSDAAKAGVPATVTIPAGSYYAYFYVTGVDLTNGVPVTVDATAVGYNNPATKLAVNVITPVFNFNGLDTNRSPASIRDDFSLSASVPGAGYSGNQTAVADLQINLSIAAGSPAGIVDGFYSALTGGTAITQVILHRDNMTSDTVYVGTPTAAGNYKVQASATGIATATSGVLTVIAPELRFAPANGGNTVFAGKGLKTYVYEVYVYRAVNGKAFNGTDALTVNLTCSAAAICAVPASVTIPAGQSSVYFLVEGVGLGTTTITSSAVGYNATQDLGVNVTAPQLNFNGPGSTTIGGKTNFSVYLSVPNAGYSSSQTATNSITINVTSSAPGVATAPATVIIPAGSASTNTASLTGVAAGTTTLTASGAGLSSATSSVITINP